MTVDIKELKEAVDRTYIALDGGKYEIIMKDREFKALRYGEEWRDLTGDNLIFHLVQQLIEREAQMVEPIDGELTIDDYKECLEDQKRLVRKLDELLNGKDGMAEQASLCDIVAQVQSTGTVIARKIDGVDEALLSMPREDMHETIFWSWCVRNYKTIKQALQRAKGE